MAERILVVDDETQITRVLRTALAAQGYDVRAANDPEEGLRTFEEWAPDLLITDLVMPGQAGIETIVVVRKDYPNLKILAISGFGGGSHLKAAQMLGANKTLPKPVDINHLCSTVSVLIGA